MYKKRTEVAKKEYLKQLAAYKASQVSQVSGFTCTQTCVWDFYWSVRLGKIFFVR